MTTWARVLNNQAVDVVTVGPDEIFHADVAVQFVEVPEGTQDGATLANGVWTPPQSANEVLLVTYPLLSAAQFYFAFAAAEMVAIKNSTDAMVKEFFARYQVAQDTQTQIDPNLQSVQEGLTYLAQPSIAIIAESRIPEISKGHPK